MYYEEAIISSRNKDLNLIQSFLQSKTFIKGAVLFGSFARGEENYQSDIDIALFVSESSTLAELKQELQEHSSIVYIMEIKQKNTLVLLLENGLKVDLLCFNDINEKRFCRNYIYSEIPADKITDSILFDKTGLLLSHLKEITEKYDPISNMNPQFYIDEFINAFENCSRLHAKSDAYRYYFNYNIALQYLIQLKHIISGNKQYNYTPRNFTTNCIQEENLEDFYKLGANFDLTKGNSQKRILLDYFYETLHYLSINTNKIKAACELIYDRDYFWNFRDISTHTSKTAKNNIYRSSSLSFFSDINTPKALLVKNNIDTIIDLRAESEADKIPYKSEVTDDISYFNIPFDPWNQPEWFKADKSKHIGTNAEIAYRYFVLACKSQIKNVFQTILKSKNGILIHCHAGKDRTGIIVALIHLLLEEEIKVIEKDYLASNMDTSIDKINILLCEIERVNGVIPYLLSCGLSMYEITTLKMQLCQ